VVGLIAGLLAKWIMPGEGPGGLLVTLILGMAGASLGGFVVSLPGGTGATGFNVWSIIVVGSRGIGTVKRLVTGCVSEGVVHLAPCPVLVMRGDEAWPPGDIVVGDDSSEEAKRAGELAMSLGQFPDRD
jgi:uncharacterized membrane protein YeaQ/YmgE (transglycosylase-associated protein family)